LRQAQVIGGARKAAMARDGFENLQRIERRKASHRDIRNQKKSLRGRRSASRQYARQVHRIRDPK
jgi:hypothetical protein